MSAMLRELIQDIALSSDKTGDPVSGSPTADRGLLILQLRDLERLAEQRPDLVQGRAGCTGGRGGRAAVAAGGGLGWRGSADGAPTGAPCAFASAAIAMCAAAAAYC